MARRKNSRPIAVAPRPAREGVKAPSPGIANEVNKVFLGYLKGLAISLVVFGGTAVAVVFAAHVSKSISPVLFLVSVLLGTLLAYKRGMDRTFRQLLELGRQKLQQRLYADAAYVLEQFHKKGNMGFDRTGEAHYLLWQAYKGMGETLKAEETEVWLKKNRPRSIYLAKLPAV